MTLQHFDCCCHYFSVACFSLTSEPNMTSGAKVSDRVKDLYNSMKVVKSDADPKERLRLVVFHIKDGIIDATDDKIFRQKDLGKEDVFKFMTNLLEPKSCCYLLYDCHYETKECGKKEELVYIMWAPDIAKVKDKMNYASSESAIKKVFTGVKHELQVNDIADCGTRPAFADQLGKNVLTLEGRSLCSDEQSAESK
ncbi:non-muscle cofilin 1-like [Aulostomus maculatus]